MNCCNANGECCQGPDCPARAIQIPRHLDEIVDDIDAVEIVLIVLRLLAYSICIVALLVGIGYRWGDVIEAAFWALVSQTF